MNEEKYLIPKRLAKQNTLFEGVGPKEIGFILLGVMVSIILFLPIKAIVNVWVALLVAFIPTGGSVMLIWPMSYKENLIIKGKRFFDYQKQQKRFFYYRGTR